MPIRGRSTSGDADASEGTGTSRPARSGTSTITSTGTGTGRGTDDTPTPLSAPAPERLAWDRGDALVAIGTAAVDLIGYSLGAADQGRPLTLAGCALLVLAALCLVLRRTRPLTALTGVLGLGTVLNFATTLQGHFTAALAVALYTVARQLPLRRSLPAAAVTVPASLVGLSGGLFDPAVLGNLVAAALVTGAGVLMRRRAQEAAAHRLLLAEAAVAAERRRIARELHDIVAHHITTMQLMAGGARVNLARDPQAARQALVTLEGSGRMALREMRQLLDVLRAGEEPETGPPAAPQPGTADLERLVAEARQSGTDTRLTVDGPVRDLPPSVGLTAFRVVQEALTNTRKHAAGGARVRVRLAYGAKHLTIEVHDDGAGRTTDRGPAAPGPSVRPSKTPGYGLIGMRERVALLGGTLETGPDGTGGYRVTARLPAAADEDDAGPKAA
ncbi:sensor histidine kinase [Streptomyces sp. NPDC058877]|uniref:sensor histidine kinase n=1 Tax=unclassified Streptomyces TaxID=2593676 RepID=UPI0036A70604